jgi:hypothetical protein
VKSASPRWRVDRASSIGHREEEALLVVLVRAPRDRDADLPRLYSGMNASMDRICAGYEDTGLELLADFLGCTADARRSATDELSAE